jgi:hypothetical protein
MHNDAIGRLTVQVARHGDKYAWKLYSDGHYSADKIFRANLSVGRCCRARCTGALSGALGALGSEATENQDEP